MKLCSPEMNITQWGYDHKVLSLKDAVEGSVIVDRNRTLDRVCLCEAPLALSLCSDNLSYK